MEIHEFKKLLIRSLDNESDPAEVSKLIRDEAGGFEFREGFRENVMRRIYSAGAVVARETDFIRNLTYVFYRIALPGIAAIILLMFSIFLMEGSLSFDSFLGLSNNDEESIICLLTGN